MDKYLIINKIEDYKNINRSFSGVYIGHEFCPRLIPKRDKLLSLFSEARKRKLKYSFITPYIDSNTLEHIKIIFKFLYQKNYLKEIIVNDLGLLNYAVIKYPKCKVIVGRGLSRYMELNKESCLFRLGINRIEFDILKKIREKKEKIIKQSYYMSTTVISVTRYCPVVKKDVNGLDYSVLKCNKECEKTGLINLKSSMTNQKLFLTGNTIFIKKNEKVNKIINIDRLIFNSK